MDAMQPKQIAQHVIAYFEAHDPHPTTALQYANDFQLLVAVMLSAQCTDKQVNKVTPNLFKTYPTPLDIAKASIHDIYQHIQSITYPNTKAKHLISASQMLVQHFDGKVPNHTKDLQTLPGIGRKSAHVIVSILHQAPFFAVDTHVKRTTRRLGLVPLTATTPLRIEKQITELVSKEYLHKLHHWLIDLGKHICQAKKPKCPICPLTQSCTYFRMQQTKNTS